MTVAPHWIIEYLNKTEYLSLGFFAYHLVFSLDHSLPKCGKEAFGNRVVMAIATTSQ